MGIFVKLSRKHNSTHLINSRIRQKKILLVLGIHLQPAQPIIRETLLENSNGNSGKNKQVQVVIPKPPLQTGSWSNNNLGLQVAVNGSPCRKAKNARWRCLEATRGARRCYTRRRRLKATRGARWCYNTHFVVSTRQTFLLDL